MKKSGSSPTDRTKVRWRRTLFNVITNAALPSFGYSFLRRGGLNLQRRKMDDVCPANRAGLRRFWTLVHVATEVALPSSSHEKTRH